MSGKFMARAGLVCFSLGVILLYCLTVLPPSYLLVPLGALAGLAAIFLPAGILRKVSVLCALLLGGFAWSAWNAGARIDSRLPSDLEGELLEVSGYVCGVPEPGSFQSVRFPFCVTHWHKEHWLDKHQPLPNALPRRLRLAWYGDNATVEIPSRLRLTVVLKKPHGAVNPRGFRYESWLFRQNYGATGTIRALASDSAVICAVQCQYHQWRTSMVRNLLQRVQGTESGPLIASLMLGYRGELEPGQWQVLKATGTIHLVAISGLHLGLVAIGAGFLIRRSLVWLPERWLPPARFRLVQFWLICLASLFYALAAGFSVPTRRALIMVMVGCWWVFNARRGQAVDAVLLALGLVLALDPFSPLDQGFWLSFAAVGILTLVFSGTLRPTTWWRSLVLAQVAIFAALWPILTVLGQSQPLAGFFANLVAIPLVSLLIMPAVFLCALVMVALPWLEPAFIGGLDFLLTGLWQFLELAAGLTLPLITPAIGELWFAALAVSLGLAIPFRGFRAMLAVTATLWLGMAGGIFGEKTEEGNTHVRYPEMWVWDVGQGLSVLVRQEDGVLLYDTGPALEGVYSAVESVLVPNLKSLGIRTINTLIISHADGDHSGGIPLLLEHFEVETIVSGEPERLAQRFGPESRPKVLPCEGFLPERPPVPVNWQWDQASNGNDASCVLTLAFNDGRHSVILAGDITGEAEQAFLQDNPELHPEPDSFRVVLAPHHGSKTSSSSEWVNGLAPDLVIFSSGYRHRYGHPHPDIVARYENAGSRLLNTATSGAVHLAFAPGGVEVTGTRQGAAFWLERWVER